MLFRGSLFDVLALRTTAVRLRSTDRCSEPGIVMSPSLQVVRVINVYYHAWAVHLLLW